MQFFAEKAKADPKFTDVWPNEQMKKAHPQLVKDLDTFKANVEKVASLRSAQDQAAQLRKTIDHFKDFCKDMMEHLDEEEDVGLAFLRRHATREDVKPMEEKIVADLLKDPQAANWFFFWGMHEGADRANQCDIFGIPAPGKFMINRDLKKLRNDLVNRLEASAVGRPSVPQKDMIYDKVKGEAFWAKGYSLPILKYSDDFSQDDFSDPLLPFVVGLVLFVAAVLGLCFYLGLFDSALGFVSSKLAGLTGGAAETAAETAAKPAVETAAKPAVEAAGTTATATA